MTEEEIIKTLQEIIQKNQQVIKEAYKNKDINTMQLVADIDNEAIAIQGLLDLYDKQKKMTDLMAEYLTSPIHDKQGVIDYFKKKVEEDK